MSENDVMSRPSRDVFEAGPGRKMALSFVFLLLLPFFVSLFPMLYFRLTLGDGEGLLGLLVVAVGLSLLMLLVLIELMISLRSRVAFGKNAVALRLPRGRGIFPSLIYNSRTIPYSDISNIEIRREIYGGQWTPVLLKGTRVILKDETAVPLGYVSEANVDPALPFDEIAEKIAARAGVEIDDAGHVRRSAQRKIMGLRATEEERVPISPDEVAELNVRHGRAMFALVGALMVMVGAGIFTDRDLRYPWSNPVNTSDTAQSGGS
ncbi:MAG: hypothetical protein AAFV45_12305 [Pseudomonadota bacterium]